MMSQHDNQDTRFLLWVDAVGGYLVCRDDVVLLGQAVPGNQVAVPILADISRQHAILERSGDRYLLRPMQSTRVSGELIHRPTLIRDGDRIELGDGVHLKFRQPHTLSASALLEFESHHKAVPTVDAVILMAESCLLGPDSGNHIVCRDWNENLVLYRRGRSLACRSPQACQINGVTCQERGDVPLPSNIAGDGFSFSLESLS